uniref:WAT1-related protein n=1 Tax=Helianthus annuus TaxID=4232 RepID=A0A251V4Q8_HELAN
MQRLKATLCMVAAKFSVAAFTISYKLAANDGMNMKVLITYRYLFASILILPLALFLERGPMAQNMYSKSLVLTSTTFTAAFTNLIPPLTFIIAVLLRLEKVEIGTISGKAKVFGTLVGVGGAMVLTFYKGHQLNIGSTHFNLLHNGQRMGGHVAATHKNSTHDHIFGSILALGYSLSIALYYIFQRKLSANYPCHYSNTFLSSVFGFIQSLVYAVPTESSLSQWKLGSKFRLFSAIFQGMCSLGTIFFVTAAVHLQGPLFVSTFNPLVLVFVAIAGFLLLDEKLYVGSLLGSLIIIVGLYLVLWGKGRETKRLTPPGSSKDGNVVSKTNANTTTLENVSVAPTSFSAKIDEGDTNSQMEKNKEKEIVEEV